MTTLVMNRIEFESFEFLYTKPNSESHYAGWGRSYKFGHFPMASDLMLYQYWYPVWYKKYFWYGIGIIATSNIGIGIGITSGIGLKMLIQISVSVSV